MKGHSLVASELTSGVDNGQGGGSPLYLAMYHANPFMMWIFLTSAFWNRMMMDGDRFISGISVDCPVPPSSTSLSDSDSVPRE